MHACDGILAIVSRVLSVLLSRHRLWKQICDPDGPQHDHANVKTLTVNVSMQRHAILRLSWSITLLYLLLCFNVLGTNRGPTDRSMTQRRCSKMHAEAYWNCILNPSVASAHWPRIHQNWAHWYIHHNQHGMAQNALGMAWHKRAQANVIV